MKFSMRIKLVLIVAMLVMMLASSAWAVDITSIQVVPTLDSTGTTLTLEYTFYVDGVKYPHFEEIIGSSELERLKVCNGVRTDIQTADKTLVCSVISTNEQVYADRLIADYTLDTPLESGNYLIQYEVWRNDPNTEVMPDDEMAALQAKYPEVVERDPEGMYANNEQPISIVREESGSNVDSVTDAITAFGLNAVVNGNTITVKNTGPTRLEKTASEVLYLGDISGLIIDWQASVNVVGGQRPDRGVGMINFTGGEFKMSNSTIEIKSADGWVDAICGSGTTTVTMDEGSTVVSDRTKSTGISLDDGTLVFTTGEVLIPNGNAVFAMTVEGASNRTVNGAVFTPKDGNPNELVVYMYGTPTAYDETEILPTAKSDDLSRSWSYVVKSGATWTIDCLTPVFINVLDSITIEPGGKLVIKNLEFHNYGTFTNDGDLTNNGKLSNYSSNSINNNGTLTNNGTLSNAATGKITNTGTIDNASGTISNAGTIDNTSGTIKSDAADFSGNEPTGNPITPATTSPNDNNNGGGGGCNAGFGMIALLLAGCGLMAHKSRKA